LTKRQKNRIFSRPDPFTRAGFVVYLLGSGVERGLAGPTQPCQPGGPEKLRRRVL